VTVHRRDLAWSAVHSPDEHVVAGSENASVPARSFPRRASVVHFPRKARLETSLVPDESRKTPLDFGRPGVPVDRRTDPAKERSAPTLPGGGPPVGAISCGFQGATACEFEPRPPARPK